MHRLEAPERAHPHATVADAEVGALDERVAEVRREEGVLEGGLAPRPRREHHDARRLGGRGRDVLQRGAQRAEERCEPVHVGVAVQVGQDAGDDDAVLERVPGPRRRLGAIGQHHPGAVVVAAEVDRGVEELVVAGQPDLVALAEEAGVPEHDLGRDDTFVHQSGGGRRGR